MSSITKLPNGRWSKQCSNCGEMQSYLRKHYATESLRLNKCCKKCSNKKTENCHRGWHRGIRVSWFNKFKLSSELRNIDFLISIDDVADLYEYQNKKCALTGWDIGFAEFGKLSKITASIDRIKNDLGYVKENIQLVYKTVNMMKQKYSQEEFIDICIAVCNNVNFNKK